MTTQQAFALALQHHQAGRLADAEALYRQILAAEPSHADALHFLGVIASQMGRHDLAAKWIRQALLAAPNNPIAHSNLGEVYYALGRPDEAMACYRRAIELNPQSAPAHYNLANVLRDRGQLDEALAAYRRTLELRPDFPEAYNNLASVLKDQGLLDEALATYRRAIQLQPEQSRLQSNLIYTLHFHPDADRETISEEWQRWNRQFGDPLKPFVLPHGNERDPERRLRIGYVSPDFRDQVVGRNIAPLLRCHDHQRYEIFCYSGVEKPDSLTDEFRQHADHWRDTTGVGDEALARMIREDGIDILVDLTQHMARNRLPVFARRPAPVQMSFAGYPASTGLEAIGCRISDRYLESSGISQTETGEQVCLIDSFWCYDPCGVELAVNELPAQKQGRVTFGGLNNFCKVNERVLQLWGRVLAKVGNSHLVLLSDAGSHRQRTLEVLERAGVEACRVEFLEPLPRRAYLELYHRLDIILDPFPYNGHSTSLDALWMGVPVVTLAGPQSVSRAGYSQLSNLGLPELVAFLEEEYVKIATELAGDLPRLAELRKTLRPRMEASPLMDAPRFARNIETSYRTMWRRWCADQQSQTP